MSISPELFRAAYNRFQAIHRQQCGFDLDTFRNPHSYAFIAENYKEDVQRSAARILNAGQWTTEEVGTGSILQRVTQAIEQRQNNLVHWKGRNGPQSRVHAKMLQAASQAAKLRKLEAAFFDMYNRNQAGESQFADLLDICGKYYELIAYFFFLVDPLRFLPIRTRSFDLVLNELGFSLKTERHCNWENYQSFLKAIRDVQVALRAGGIPDATLLDAHSFCWILARFPRDGESDSTHSSNGIRRRLFSGSLQVPNGEEPFLPHDDAPQVDMQEIALRRAVSGQSAEDIALEAEQQRLQQEGRPDLARQIESVSDRPGFGFDIKSFNADGTERCIEVKNVSGGNRFFLSHGEWQNSRVRPNFWFYLVSEADDDCPLVTLLHASTIEQRHLQATQYVVTYTQ